MGGFYPSRSVVLFDGSSANSSTYTSGWHLVADYAQASVSWVSSSGSASRLTLSGSNDDGLSAAITNSSVLSDIGTRGLYAVTMGMRWVRAQRSAVDSQGSVILQLRV